MIKKLIKINKGYTLLFAVLVSAVTLAIGISILNISKKEFLLASTARDSSLAFYAADSGLECAWYYEFENSNSPFSTSTQSGAVTISCGNSNSIPISVEINNDIYGTGIMSFYVPLDNNSCAGVTITKEYVNNKPHNKIESRGYNLGWNAGKKDCSEGPAVKKVERALRLSY